MSMLQDNAQGKEDRLPLRDWILLPLFSLLVIVLVAGLIEFTGWRMFPWSGSHSLEHDCVIRNDRSTGVRGRPNSVCWDKIAETPPIEYRFNSCGHRAGMECGPKPPGTYRIVIVGSSLAMGLRVPQQQTLAALLPAELSQRTGRKVEVYNEAMPWGSPHTVDLRFNEIVAQQPDMILWLLTNYDLKYPAILFQEGWEPEANAAKPHVAEKKPGLIEASWKAIQSRVAGKSFTEAVQDVMQETRTSLMLRHFLYENEDQYVKACLMSRDETGYLTSNPDENWQRRLQQFEPIAANIEKRAQALGIPFVATMVPTRVQAAMMSMGTWPDGYNPYVLDDEFQSIITKHGGTYIRISHNFKSIPNSEKYYLPVDGHPTAQGHAMLSNMIAQELTSGAVPSLRSTDQASITLGKSR